MPYHRIAFNNQRHTLLWRWAFLGACFLYGSVHAQSSELSEGVFFDEMPVVLTVSRLAQPLSDVPGAVTVLDRETIRRSGARTLADVLRLVPGYVVSGYNGANPVAAYHAPLDEFGNRNLVLIDGRSLYSSANFGGTIRGMQGVLLDDVERIEVLRGSNSAAYGANAMFGVINIVTRHAADTLGQQVRLGVGNAGIRDFSVRWGWRDAGGSHRLGLSSERDTGYESVNDDLTLKQLKWRSDLKWDADTEWSVQAGLTDKHSGDGVPSNYDNPERPTAWWGAYLHSTWRRDLSPQSQLSWMLSWDEEATKDAYRYARPGLEGVLIDVSSRDRRLNGEVQWQNRASTNWRWVAGAGFKQDSVTSWPLFATHDRITINEARVFGHAEWAFKSDWLLNAGALLARNEVTGTYFSPRLMVNHDLTPNQTVRAGISLAQKAPTVFQLYGDVRYYRPDGTYVTTTYVPNLNLVNEELVTREVSYYGRFPGANVVLDARLYDEQLTDEIRERRAQRRFLNLGAVGYQGLDLQLIWTPAANTRWILNHNLNQMVATATNASGSREPPLQLSTVAWFQDWPLGWNTGVIWHRYSAMTWRTGGSLPATQRLDLRLARRFQWEGTRAEAAWVVQAANGDHPVFTTARPSVFARRAYATLNLEF